MKVLKRDGREVGFDKNLIENAVYNAALSSNWKPDTALGLGDKIAERVHESLVGQDTTTVEDIQDLVEHKLMCSKAKDVARDYIRYRAERSNRRDEKNKWARIGLDITSGEDTESQRENSNVPRGTVTTQVEMIKRSYAKQFADDFILPEKFKEAHEAGEIHVHDKDALITKIPNCILMDYPYMFRNGFQLGNKWIEEPSSILTAMNILVQMVQVQSNLEFGGITLPDIDVHLGKYVLGSYKKYMVDALCDLQDISDAESEEQLSYCVGDLHPENRWVLKYFERESEIAIRKTKRETYKACKLLSYQMNTLQVRGESSPFTTIGYGNSTTWEGRLIQQSILQERLDEFNRSGVQEFPKHLMAVRKGVNFNKEDPNYDLFKFANKVSAISCYPDYCFPENQEKHTGGSAFYMG